MLSFVVMYDVVSCTCVEHSTPHQAIQNQNKLTVDCTRISYKASSSNTSFA